MRGAGFPVDGLEVFGPGDESARLREVARDPVFQEAVAWQNRAALENNVVRLAAGPASKPSRQRQREELVASYWQRYTAKNDTIGFFGPLAWGRVADGGPSLTAEPVPADREVHFEHWAIEALAATLDPGLRIPIRLHAERDLRALLDTHPDPAVRDRGVAGLQRLEAARNAVAEAPRERLPEALAALDALFVELTERDATRRPGEAYAGRSLVYLECTRGKRFGLGGLVLDELRRTLPLIFTAGRWYCRQVYERGVARVREAAARDPEASPAVLFRELAPSLLDGPEDLPGLLADLQRRWQRVVDADDGARAALAAELFDDEGPLWTLGVYHSADVQIAVRDTAAADRGEFLCVVADVHPGGNPLTQPVFSARLPTDVPVPEIVAEDTGGFALFAPPIRPGGFSPRVVPFIALPHVLHIATSPDVVIPPDRPIVPLPLLERRGERFVTPDGSAEGPLEALFEFPMFVGSVRNFSLAAAGEHTPRTTLGRTVTHRESWEPHPRGVPADAPALASWARDQGMPRRVFLLSSEEPKPMYVDLDSPVLTRLAARVVRRTAEAEGTLRFSEMLPGPEDCWLTDDAGRRYTSELRLAAVDTRLRAARA